MRIVLQYFDDCPNWRIADEHLHAALEQVGRPDAVVVYQIVDTEDAAQEHDFHGSPTIRINGVDPFADESTAVGLSCRRFATEAGIEGAPTVRQLVAALTVAR